MFAKTNTTLPEDAHFDADLGKLGFQLNEKSQFVSTTNPEKFFDWYHTDNERTNFVRKEAMHEAARKVMMEELAKQGIKQLYLHGTENCTNFVKLTATKPDGPHINILCSDLDQLRKAKTVVCVMGEHYQDTGVWAYRELMNKGGLDVGSAVGLAKAMKSNVTRKDSIQGTNEITPVTAPGLIILNPGQLLYSPSKNTCQSKSTWLGKQKENALLPEHAVNEAYNVVSGHESPETHLATFLNAVYKQICHRNARLFMVGIGDGGDNIVKALDQMYHEDSQNYIGGQLHGLCFVQPSFTHDSVISVALQHKLATVGQSWIMHDLPKGSVIKMPQVIQPSISITQATPIVPAPIAATPITFESGNTGRRGRGLLTPGSDGELRTVASADSMLFAMDNINAKQDPAELKDYTSSFRRAGLPRPKTGRTARDAALSGDVDFLKHSPAGSGSSTPYQPDSPGFSPSSPPDAYATTLPFRTTIMPEPTIESVIAADAARARAAPGGADMSGAAPTTDATSANENGRFARSAESSPDDYLYIGGRKGGKSAISAGMTQKRTTAAQADSITASAVPAVPSTAESVVSPFTTDSSNLAMDPSWAPLAAAEVPPIGEEAFNYDATEVSCLTRSAGPVVVPELIFPEVMGEVLAFFAERYE